MGKGAESKSLPDWDLVSFEDVKGQHIPSFWAAEVEELPRGAGIEWAALEGIAGAVKVIPSFLCKFRCANLCS
jgi:hypothetical protein